MVLGRQFHDSFGPEPLRSKAISIINKRADSDKPLLEGDDARTVFRAANIRSWGTQDTPNSYMSRSGTSGVGDIDLLGWRHPDEVLNTFQNEIYAPGVQKYMSGDVPELDSTRSGIPIRYLPEVITSYRGNLFLGDGHHRMIASRLLGKVQDTWESWNTD